ncbi:MAG: TonB-dependent receptor [Verrucomicrobia bacterium]|nr:TonB-dependent receptor [Verrucomicrobiota bacterium]
MSLPLLSLLLAQAPARLPETVVVETRQASDLAEASPSVSRLDGAAAVEAGYTTLGGLLSSAPGVYATEQSGEGSQASLFIRGMNSTHTAVLLDGRRLPQGFSGSYELGRYRVYGLSSIELLRGPASSAYGANAIGGVVDMRLPDPLRSPAGGSALAEGGSYGRAAAAVSVTSNDAASGREATRGLSVTATTTRDDGWRDNGARDATTALLSAGWKLAPGVVADLVGSVDRGHAGLPGSAPGSSGDPNDWQRDGGWLLSPGVRFDNGTVRGAAFWSHAGSSVTSLIDTTGPFAFTSHQRYLLERDELTAYADWTVRPGLSFGAGVTYERNDFDQRMLSPGGVDWRDVQESFGGWLRTDWRLSSADRLRATVRQDAFTEYDGRTSGELAWSHRLTKELVLHAKAGTSYRTPSGNDLAYGTAGGLPLRPESSVGYEIGLRHEDLLPGALSWTFTVFRNDVEDLIDFDPASFYLAYNIAEARTQGAELWLETRPAKGVRLFGSATLLSTEVLSPLGYLGTAAQGEQLLRRPDFALSLGAELIPVEDWIFGLAVTHLRGREDFDFGAFARVDLPDATYARLWIRRTIAENTEISLRVENLTGEDAPPAALGFGPQPRSAYLGLTRRF